MLLGWRSQQTPWIKIPLHLDNMNRRKVWVPQLTYHFSQPQASVVPLKQPQCEHTRKHLVSTHYSSSHFAKVTQVQSTLNTPSPYTLTSDSLLRYHRQKYPMTPHLTLTSAPVILPGHPLCREPCEPQAHAYLSSRCPTRSPLSGAHNLPAQNVSQPQRPCQDAPAQNSQDTPVKKALRSPGLQSLRFHLPSQSTLYMKSLGLPQPILQPQPSHWGSSSMECSRTPSPFSHSSIQLNSPVYKGDDHTQDHYFNFRIYNSPA